MQPTLLFERLFDFWNFRYLHFPNLPIISYKKAISLFLKCYRLGGNKKLLLIHANQYRRAIGRCPKLMRMLLIHNYDAPLGFGRGFLDDVFRFSDCLNSRKSPLLLKLGYKLRNHFAISFTV